MKVLVGHSVVTSYPSLSEGLSSCSDVTVVHPRHGFHSFVEEMRKQRPDVVLTTDALVTAVVMALPQLDNEVLPPHKRVVVTGRATPTLLVVAAQTGFDDVVEADQPSEAVATQLRELVEGRRDLRAHPIWRMLDYPTDMTRLEVVMADEVDRQIVGLVAAGLSDREIADLVYLSCQTVRNRVSRLLDRCGARNRTQLALLYVRSQYERVVRQDPLHDVDACRFDHFIVEAS